jgi:CxxC motif-containing protein (DUF1111 family)
MVIIGCDGLMTSPPTRGDDFESAFDDLPHELNAMFAAGDENFERVFIVSDGLGPIFNNTGCASCHPGDGRGTPNEALIRFSVNGDLLPAHGGPQLQDKAIPGVLPESLPGEVALQSSTRLPPPVFGVGLIEHIPAEAILANADPDDSDGDGVSGRPNWVRAAPFVPSSEIGGGAGDQLGRFGRKANVSSLLQQVVEAYHQDIGITSDFLPSENPHPQAGGFAVGDIVADPELTAAEVLQTTVYVRLLAPPKRGSVTARVETGKEVFYGIGCAKCHVPTMHTGPSNIGPLDRVAVHLYSDLLIHDMGDGLADHRPDGQASGYEWKTPPLWGTRLVREFLNGKAFYLHDGRATTLDEAIRWHGGEAESAKLGYEALDEARREALLAFLRSL